MSFQRYTKYSFHTYDHVEAFTILAGDKGKVLGVKNNKTPFYQSLNIRRYVQGSVKNISEGPRPEFDFDNMSQPPVVGEHLVSKSYFGFHTDITDLVLTEINPNFYLDSNLIQSPKTKYLNN